MVSEDDVHFPRKLDHCVLPTADLAVARDRLEALGFTVAADAAHPFGTANCCVFFADGSYLEPLSRVAPQVAREAEDAGNVFVQRDSGFREKSGDEGFSAVALGTGDADEDHRRFVKAGISAGTPLSFSRPFRDSSGQEATASFRLAFAAPEDADGHFFFTCQRVNLPSAGRGALETHQNGVTGTARIILLATAPADQAGFLEAFSAKTPETVREDQLDLSLGNAVLTVMTPDRYRVDLGLERAASHGRLDLAAIVFQCPDIARLRAQLSMQEVLFAEQFGSIIVPPAAGQGAVFVFEESTP
ncbi:VOC family protein [Nitratireductor kimnyeongensis]|uniref:VOC family protein n=1 Tax=Nitratireductor kimnyeongensis TaxID=430679 RepID=A0ABW0T4K4_9HYPH|nr:VOC family protein [Nitratireductor kimnyeongensis]QZZ35450.1 VOC family protein [Nitratireductor kimnyeongensis]